MAILFIDSFAYVHNGLNLISQLMPGKWDITAVGTISPTTSGRNGRQGVIFNNGASAKKILPSAPQTIVCGVAAKIHSANDSGIAEIISLGDESSNIHITVRRNADNTVDVRAGDVNSTTVLATASRSLVVGEFTFIELKATINQTVGAFELRFNGLTVAQASNVNTKNAAASTASVKTFWIGASVSAWRHSTTYSDLYIADTVGGTDFLGNIRVDCITPNAAGNYAQWSITGGTAHWQVASDGDDGTFISTDSIGAKDSFNFSDLPSAPGQPVLGIQPIIRASKTDTGYRQIAPFVRIGGADYASAAYELTVAAKTTAAGVMESNPATAAAWTEAQINALELGVVLAG